MVFLIPVALSYGVDPGGGGPKPDRAKKEGNGPKEAGGDGPKVNKGPRGPGFSKLSSYNTEMTSGKLKREVSVFGATMMAMKLGSWHKVDIVVQLSPG